MFQKGIIEALLFAPAGGLAGGDVYVGTRTEVERFEHRNCDTGSPVIMRGPIATPRGPFGLRIPRRWIRRR